MSELREISDIGLAGLLELIDGLHSENDKISYTILGWEDGDWFTELCEEDGGVIAAHQELFSTMPLALELNSLDELKLKLREFEKTPFLHSVNKNYKFEWDFHLWMGKYNVIYNAHLDRVEVYTLSWFEKITQSGALPNWINEEQVKRRIDSKE